MNVIVSKVHFSIDDILWLRTPTTKAVGSELVTKYQPTALVVGDAKKEAAQTFQTALLPKPMTNDQ